MTREQMLAHITKKTMANIRNKKLPGWREEAWHLVIYWRSLPDEQVSRVYRCMLDMKL